MLFMFISAIIATIILLSWGYNFFLYRSILSGHYESHDMSFWGNQRAWKQITPYLINDHIRTKLENNDSHSVLFQTYCEQLYLWNGLLNASLLLKDTETVKKIDCYILHHLLSGKIRKDEFDNLRVMAQQRNSNDVNEWNNITDEWKKITKIIDFYAVDYNTVNEYIDFSFELLQDEIVIAIQKFLQDHKKSIKHLFPSRSEYTILKNNLYFQESEFSYQYNRWNILQKKDRIIVKFILFKDNSIEPQTNTINGILEIHFVYQPKEKKFEVIFWCVSPYVE
ncbi:MAG: hypothetical protein LBE12_05890 [Planctomycetaceae bacterium]|nr:hypothetical protein [Planctomycetaceae bacterium]